MKKMKKCYWLVSCNQSLVEGWELKLTVVSLRWQKVTDGRSIESNYWANHGRMSLQTSFHLASSTIYQMPST